MRKTYISIVLVILLASCLAKNGTETAGNSEREEGTQEVQNVQETQTVAARERPARPPGTLGMNKTMFVDAPAGLRVRNSPGLDGDVIGVLSDLSEVTTLWLNERIEVIDKIVGYWMFVETDDIQGWVFDGFLSSSPRTIFGITSVQIPTDVYPAYIEVAGRNHRLVFSDGSRKSMNFGRATTWSGNMGNIRVFSTNSRESEYKFIEKHIRPICLFRIDQIEDWLFWDSHGFVFIYDFPTGGHTQHEDSLLVQFPKFRRYGPLLEVNHNNSIIWFWDIFSDSDHYETITLAAYFEAHEAILLEHNAPHFRKPSFSIYSLQMGVFTDFKKKSFPQFNPSKDTVISIDYDTDYTGTILLDVYAVDNGVYNSVNIGMPSKEYTEHGISAGGIIDARWINDNEFRLVLNHPDEYEDSIFLLLKRNGARFELLQEQ